MNVPFASLALLACAAPVGAQQLPPPGTNEPADSTAIVEVRKGPGLLPSVVGGSLAAGGLAAGSIGGFYYGAYTSNSWDGAILGMIGGAFLGSYALGGVAKGLNGGHGSALGAAVFGTGAGLYVYSRGTDSPWKVLGASVLAGAVGFHIGPGSRGSAPSGRRMSVVPVTTPDGQGVYAVVRF